MEVFYPSPFPWYRWHHCTAVATVGWQCWYWLQDSYHLLSWLVYHLLHSSTHSVIYSTRLYRRGPATYLELYLVLRILEWTGNSPDVYRIKNTTVFYHSWYEIQGPLTFLAIPQNVVLKTQILIQLEKVLQLFSNDLAVFLSNSQYTNLHNLGFTKVWQSL